MQDHHDSFEKDASLFIRSYTTKFNQVVRKI